MVERIKSARAKIRGYEKKYGVPYQVFARLVQTDGRFLRRVERKNPAWEEDAMEWAYRFEEIEELANKPQIINHKSKTLDEDSNRAYLLSSSH